MGCCGAGKRATGRKVAKRGKKNKTSAEVSKQRICLICLQCMKIWGIKRGPSLYKRIRTSCFLIWKILHFTINFLLTLLPSMSSMWYIWWNQTGIKLKCSIITKNNVWHWTQCPHLYQQNWIWIFEFSGYLISAITLLKQLCVSAWRLLQPTLALSYRGDFMQMLRWEVQPSIWEGFGHRRLCIGQRAVVHLMRYCVCVSAHAYVWDPSSLFVSCIWRDDVK